MAENKEKLFTEFPPISTAEWKAKVEADLKGADFAKLVWRTNEGFKLVRWHGLRNVGYAECRNQCGPLCCL